MTKYADMVRGMVQRFGAEQRPEELFRAGCVGLVKALDNYSVTCGVDLSTYAAPMIIGEIRRYLRAEKTQLGKGSVDEMTCKDCKHFIGGGDRGLCCVIKLDLCYETTPVCKDFEADVNKAEKVTICPKCGNEQLEWDYRFCPICGNPIKEKAPAEVELRQDACEINQL